MSFEFFLSHRLVYFLLFPTVFSSSEKSTQVPVVHLKPARNCPHRTNTSTKTYQVCVFVGFKFGRIPCQKRGASIRPWMNKYPLKTHVGNIRSWTNTLAKPGADIRLSDECPIKNARRILVHGRIFAPMFLREYSSVDEYSPHVFSGVFISGRRIVCPIYVRRMLSARILKYQSDP